MKSKRGVHFRVDIAETYKGSQWYHVRIAPSGFGVPERRFVLLDLELIEDAGLREIVADRVQLWRPEYAKTLKEFLEGSDDGKE